MSATLASHPLTRLATAGGGSRNCRFRVFYLRINGRRSVIPAWKLEQMMYALKLMRFYRLIAGLADGASTEVDATVHKQPIHLVAKADTWELRF